jgi:hypothetical protein
MIAARGSRHNLHRPELAAGLNWEQLAAQEHQKGDETSVIS